MLPPAYSPQAHSRNHEGETAIGAPRVNPRSYYCQGYPRQHCSVEEKVHSTSREFRLMYAIMPQSLLFPRFCLQYPIPLSREHFCLLRQLTSRDVRIPSLYGLRGSPGYDGQFSSIMEYEIATGISHWLPVFTLAVLVLTGA